MSRRSKILELALGKSGELWRLVPKYLHNNLKVLQFVLFVMFLVKIDNYATYLKINALNMTLYLLSAIILWFKLQFFCFVFKPRFHYASDLHTSCKLHANCIVETTTCKQVATCMQLGLNLYAQHSSQLICIQVASACGYRGKCRSIL